MLKPLKTTLSNMYTFDWRNVAMKAIGLYEPMIG